MTIDERFLELDKDANVQISTSNVFEDELPVPFIPGATLEKGDKLKFPAAYTKIPKRQLGGKWHQFVVITLIKADGTTTTYDFYPKKWVRPLYEYYLVNGKAKFKGMRPHKGTAIEFMTSFIGSADKNAEGNVTKTSTQKMMEALLNAELEIIDVDKVSVAKFVEGVRSETELTDDKCYTIDKK
jgi:hypothetical protein